MFDRRQQLHLGVDCGVTQGEEPNEFGRPVRIAFARSEAPLQALADVRLPTRAALRPSVLDLISDQLAVERIEPDAPMPTAPDARPAAVAPEPGLT
jgi:hypothetical protein